MRAPYKILLVEDDPGLSFVLKDNLQREGYQVVHAADGLQAQRWLENDSFDLCLLDVMLPGVDGFTLAGGIRKSNSELPVLFISARSMQEDKLRGFSLGADDYITKPFSMEELFFRIAVFLKRAHHRQGEVRPPEEVVIGRYTLTTGSFRLSTEGFEAKLTRRENDLLLLLATRKNQVVRREEILRKLWGSDDYFAGRSLDVFISRLRKYLRHDASISIENLHGIGFQMRL